MIGNYRVVRVLGEGGAGMVYEVEHVRLGRRKAMKLLHADVPADFVARFFNEARAVNTIRHPNIIDIEDFVTLETGESFTVMDLLVGEDLRKVLVREGKLAPARTATIGKALAEALAAVHAVGIIHRDLKPENVFLETKGAGGETPKLLDFGIAKFLNESTGLTRADMTMGTPNYMAPEQIIAGGKVGLAADQYALGMLLYECLTGAPAFAGKGGRAKVLRAHCYDAPVPPSERRGEPIDAVLESIVLRCLAKAPDERFADAGELARAFDAKVPFELPPPPRARATTPVSGASVPTPPTGTPTVEPIPRRASTPPAGLPVTPPPRRSRRVLQLVPAVALIAIAIAVLAWPRGEPVAPPKLPDAAVARVVVVVDAAAAPQQFTLALVSDPPGATVLVGGKAVGTAPVTVPVDMSPAPLALVARWGDGRETTLTIVPDHARAELAFVAPRAQPQVQSTPKHPVIRKPGGPADRDATIDPFKH